MMDLYRVYRALQQRKKRAEGKINSDPLILSFAEETVEAMAEVIETPSVESCEALIDVELEYLRLGHSSAKAYGNQVLVAIQNNDYEINRPYIKKLSVSHEAPEWGVIYIATSLIKPKQVKIGYTTEGIDARFRKYKSKYGYPLKAYFHRYVENPAEKEEILRIILRQYLVSGMRAGDSIEWYHLTPKEALKIFNETILAE